VAADGNDQADDFNGEGTEDEGVRGPAAGKSTRAAIERKNPAGITINPANFIVFPFSRTLGFRDFGLANSRYSYGCRSTEFKGQGRAFRQGIPLRVERHFPDS